MRKKTTCILCPGNCEIVAEADHGQIESITGNHCTKGQEYVAQEITAPMRGVTTSILVESGELPLASVKLSRAILKGRMLL